MELSEIREQINTVDEQLLALFLQRMELSEAVAAYKNEHHLPILNKQREREILAKVTERAGDKERYAYHLFSTLMELSRSRQAELISAPTRVAAQVKASLAAGSEVFPQTGLVACQGVEGANSQVACDRIVPRGNIVYVKSFEAVFSAVESGLCRFGVVPIENSSTGAIRQVYELLGRYECYIVGENTVKVEHCLMAPHGATLDTITHVYSHEQGLFQCEPFLARHPGWVGVAHGDTAGSAQYVAQTGDITKAAICSSRAAELYGLEILARGVNYNSNNTTRFVVVSPVMELREGADKISAVLSLPDEVGSLHEVLTIFAVHGLNLVKLESRPLPGRSWEYLFFLEFDGSLADPAMDGALQELSQASAEMRVLGNFKSNL